MITPPNKFTPKEPMKPVEPTPAKAPIETGATSKISELKKKIADQQNTTPAQKAPLTIKRSANNNNNNNSDEGEVESPPVVSGKVKEMQSKLVDPKKGTPAGKQPVDIGYKPDIRALQGQVFGKKEGSVKRSVEVGQHERASNMSMLRAGLLQRFGGGVALSQKQEKQLDRYLAQPGMDEKIADKKAELEEQYGHQGDGVDPELDARIAQELADFFYAEFLQLGFDSEYATFLQSQLDNEGQIERDAEMARLLHAEEQAGGVKQAPVDPFKEAEAKIQAANAQMAEKKERLERGRIQTFLNTFEPELTKFGYTYHPETMDFTKTTLGIVRRFTMEEILDKNPRQMPRSRLGQGW